MAKFCGNCGSQQPDNARVCGNCGTPFAAPMQNTRPAPRPVANNNINPAKKANLVKWGKLAAIVLAAIVVIGLLIGIIGGGSPESVAKKYINALEKGNERKVANMVSDMFTKDAAKDLAEELVEDWEDDFEDCKITKIKIDDVEKADKDDVKDIRDEMKDGFKELKDLDKDEKKMIEKMGINTKYKAGKIKGFAEVTVEITYKDEDGDKQKDEIYVYLIKEGGSWKIFDESMMYGFMY